LEKRLPIKLIENPKSLVKDNTLYDNQFIKKIVLNRIKENKPVFRITSEESKNIKKKETKIIISNNTILDPNNNIEKIIKPKKVNVAKSNIIINNYYNIINQPAIDLTSIRQLQEEIIVAQGTNEIIYVKSEEKIKKIANKKKASNETENIPTANPLKTPKNKKIIIKTEEN
jgi:hypothetical protein